MKKKHTLFEPVFEKGKQPVKPPPTRKSVESQRKLHTTPTKEKK